MTSLCQQRQEIRARCAQRVMRRAKTYQDDKGADAMAEFLGGQILALTEFMTLNQLKTWENRQVAFWEEGGIPAKAKEAKP